MGDHLVLQCWEELILGLRKGAKGFLICTPDKGYGNEQVGPIPPNTVLTFEIEVTDVVSAENGGYLQLEQRKPNLIDLSKFEVKIKSQGAGHKLEEGDKVHIHYDLHDERGELKHSSANSEDGQPYIFTMGSTDVIRCFNEGLTGQGEGAEVELYCPADYAYGDQGKGGIPPGQGLFFKVVIEKIETSEDLEEDDEIDFSEFQVIVKEEGEGYKLQNGDKVFVHYSGELIDGTVFDSSYDRGEPLHFVLGNAVVIKCWEQGF